MNLAANLVRVCETRPEAHAVIEGDVTTTYAELLDACARFAGHLRGLGISPGDRVAVSLPNVTAFEVVYYGTLMTGAVVVPMNPLFRAREARHYLDDAQVRALVCLPGSETHAVALDRGVPVVTAEELAAALGTSRADGHVVPRHDDDTAVLLYTSGTTGAPKGAELSHRNLDTNRLLVEETLVEPQPGDIVLGCLPLFHVFGMTCALNMSVAAGTTLTLLPRFDAATAVRLMTRDRVSVFFGVPTMYSALLQAIEDVPDADVSALRLCVSGGSSMPVDLMRRFEERFGCVILEGYGLSETSPVASFNHPHAERRPGSIGTPVRGVEMTLLPVEGEQRVEEGVGEIAIRGDGLMKGYWRQPEATAAVMDADGWFRTGDLARVDEDGYYYIVDRAKDMISRGGYNVYPREVEDVIHEFPGIAEAAVVGMRHEHYGEEVGAFVVPVRGAVVDPDALRDFVRARVAPYKYPRIVQVVDSLPKGSTGKILKREIPRDVPSPVV